MEAQRAAIVSNCSDDCASSNTTSGMGCNNCNNRIDQYGNVCDIKRTTMTTWLNNSTKKPTPQTPYQYTLPAPEVP